MSILKIHTIVVPPVYSNCYVMADASGNTIIVDPGGASEEIRAIIEKNQLQVEAILNTHGHFDHVGANAEMRRHTGAPVHIHPIDAPMLGSALLCGAKWAGLEYEEHQADAMLPVGPGFSTGHFNLDIYHTPGHCPGSVCLVMPEEKIVFSGDLVFLDSIGRSDLPGGDEKILMDSLRWFLTLPDDYTVYPGHGAPTTVGRERANNPFLRRLAKQS